MNNPNNETKPEVAPITGAAELNETELDNVAGGRDTLAWGTTGIIAVKPLTNQSALLVGDGSVKTFIGGGEDGQGI